MLMTAIRRSITMKLKNISVKSVSMLTISGIMTELITTVTESLMKRQLMDWTMTMTVSLTKIPNAMRKVKPLFLSQIISTCSINGEVR